jgi:formylglycine-generating enzyme
MKKLLAAMLVALLMVGCGEDTKKPVGDSPESNQASAETPPAKTDSSAEGKAFAIADLSMEMLWVKPGTFEMGSPSSEKDRDDDETPHVVTLTQGFYLGKHEVTQSQWEKVMGSKPSKYKGADRPVEKVSWLDVTSFCNKLTASERTAGRLPAGMTYQLPTEAQWEYACRAGTKTSFSFGDSLTSRQANISGGPGETTAVGKYPANGWGFHDMHGNVWEWCADRYGIYPTVAATDPVGPADGSDRVTRGGSWDGSADLARSALRFRFEPARGATGTERSAVFSSQTQAASAPLPENRRKEAIKTLNLSSEGITSPIIVNSQTPLSNT